MTSPFIDEELRAYAAALQRAIEHHCRGLLVPDDIAQKCPLHAKKLNGALCAEARRDARRLHERDILEVYSGRGGARQWSTAGAWLYPGDELCVISMNDTALAEGK